jgi:hypothetical protein
MKEALKQYQVAEPVIKGILIGTRRDDPHGGMYEAEAIKSTACTHSNVTSKIDLPRADR